MSQQKNTDPEEYKRLHSEKETHLKRIQQLAEETNRLKAEAIRWGGKKPYYSLMSQKLLLLISVMINKFSCELK